MSKARLVSTFATSAAMLAGVCWIVTGALPLAAAPQNVDDAPGVSVGATEAPWIHRAPVQYPAAAIAKGVQGNVTVQAKLGPDGSVVDAAVVSGPEELRKAALESVLEWHFDHSAAGSTQQVLIDFTLPAEGARTTGAVLRSRIENMRAELEAKSAAINGQRAGMSANQEPKTIKSIEISGLSEEARGELLTQLPVHEGDTLSFGDFAKLTSAVRSFDSHLGISIANLPSGFNIRIRPQAFTPAAGSAPPSSIRVGGNVQQANLITKITPVYPPEAKAARVQGTVRFEATIGPDGHVQNLQVISGPPLLVNSALEAVKQWVYKPTLLNGQPVTVVTVIDVNYTLSQ